MSAQKPAGELQAYGRNWTLLIAGSFLIGLALALLLFGGRILERITPQEEPEPFEQIPGIAAQGSGRRFFSMDDLVEAGDTAPDFLLDDLDGQSHALAAYRDRPVLLNFWATWCAPCRVEMPALQAAYDRHQEDGLVILAIDFDESPTAVRDFFYQEFGLTFTPLLDKDGVVAGQYGVFNFPTSFFIGPDGVVAGVHRGPMSEAQIEAQLAQIIPAP